MKIRLLIADGRAAAPHVILCDVTEFETSNSEDPTIGMIPGQARGMLAALQGVFGRQAADKIEQLSTELTAERSRRTAAEQEVERLKRGVADILTLATTTELRIPAKSARKR